MSNSRKPDYNLTFLNTETGEKGTIGAAWLNEDESFSIRLNPFVVLQHSKAVHFRLFKNGVEYKPVSKKPSAKRNHDEPEEPKGNSPF